MLVHTGFSWRREWRGTSTACEPLRPGWLGHNLSLSRAQGLQSCSARDSGSHRLCQDSVSAARRDNCSSQSGSSSLSWDDDIWLRPPCDAQVLGTEPGHREPSWKASCRPCGSELGQEDAWRWRANPCVLGRKLQAVTRTPCCRVILCVQSPSVTPGLRGRLVKKTKSPLSCKGECVQSGTEHLFMGRGSHPHPGSDAEGSWNSQDPPREVNLGRKGHFWGPVGLKSALTPHKLAFTFKKEDTFPFTVCVCVCVCVRARVRAQSVSTLRPHGL